MIWNGPCILSYVGRLRREHPLQWHWSCLNTPHRGECHENNRRGIGAETGFPLCPGMKNHPNLVLAPGYARNRAVGKVAKTITKDIK
jgi:hypothetical protein